MTDAPGREAASAGLEGSSGELLRSGAGLLQCPDHPGVLQPSVAGLRNARCGLAIEWIAPGILGEPRPARSALDGRAIRLIQSVMVSRIYERAWRPALIRAVSGLTYARGDALIDRYLEPRTGVAVLELCCGTGRAVRRLVERSADGLGIDFSIPMLREARRAVLSRRSPGPAPCRCTAGVAARRPVRRGPLPGRAPSRARRGSAAGRCERVAPAGRSVPRLDPHLGWSSP